jgi:hypothetical protein
MLRTFAVLAFLSLGFVHPSAAFPASAALVQDEVDASCATGAEPGGWLEPGREKWFEGETIRYLLGDEWETSTGPLRPLIERLQKVRLLRCGPLLYKPDEVCCGTTNTTCGAPGCGNRACQSTDDCMGIGTGACCFDITYLPWGFCC